MTPAEITIAFIEDYKKWNDYAFQQSRENKNNHDQNIKNAYQELIFKFCSKNKKYQPLAYGSKSNHCPDQEYIVSESIVGETAVIKTKFQDKKYDFISNEFEYIFAVESGKWILEEVFLVDKTGKYKGL